MKTTQSILAGLALAVATSPTFALSLEGLPPAVADFQRSGGFYQPHERIPHDAKHSGKKADAMAKDEMKAREAAETSSGTNSAVKGTSTR